MFCMSPRDKKKNSIRSAVRNQVASKTSGNSSGISAEQFIEKLKSLRSEIERKKYERYFKMGEGQYGEGDVFIGVRMGQVFASAKAFSEMEPSEIEKLLESPIHEVRAGA